MTYHFTSFIKNLLEPAPSVLFSLILAVSLTGCGRDQDPSFGERENEANVMVKVDPNNSGFEPGSETSIDNPDDLANASVPQDPETVFDELANAPLDTDVDIDTTAYGDNDPMVASNTGDGDVPAGGGTTVDGSVTNGGTTTSGGTPTSGGTTTTTTTGKSNKGSNSSDSTADNDGAPGTSTGTTTPPAGDKVVGCPSRSEAKACADILGVPLSRVHLVSREQDVSVQQGGVIAVKLTGNKSRLNLKLEGNGDGAKVKGVCLFLAGNQSTANVKIGGLEVESLVYVGRGNQSQGTVQVNGTGSIGKIAGDLAGNQAKLTVSGEGQHPCDGVRTRGNGTAFVCQ